MSVLSEPKTEPEPVDYVERLKITEVSQKYGYLENVLRLEEEINRNVVLVSEIFSQAAEDDDIRVVAGIELSKVKLLKKGKLKMFRNLCLVSLHEIPPIEGDKEVTVDDLEGFWCLLGIEAEKHRQSVIEILKPKSATDENGKTGLPCDVTDTAVRVRTSKTPSSSSKVSKKTTAQMKAAIKVSKSNIDERNRKYMERMKKLKELKAKSIVKVQDKENRNPNPILLNSKEDSKLKQCDNMLTRSPMNRSPMIRSPIARSPRIQWQL